MSIALAAINRMNTVLVPHLLLLFSLLKTMVNSNGCKLGQMPIRKLPDIYIDFIWYNFSVQIMSVHDRRKNAKRYRGSVQSGWVGGVKC